MRPTVGFCVVREHFGYVAFLVQEAQELKYTYVVHNALQQQQQRL